ncbi:MAG: hypothetical protein JWP71_2739, partial [Mucilaginibacter sp.]|nr:hypothetical protein [Mucilaginibacter sp.]
GIHATICPGVYLAERTDLHKHRIAVKFKIIKRIVQQLFLHRYAVLLPFGLQVILALALQAGVKGASGY